MSEPSAETGAAGAPGAAGAAGAPGAAALPTSAVPPVPPQGRTARTAAIVALVLVAALAVVLATRIGEDPSPDRDVMGVTPTYSLEASEGGQVTNADLAGKVVYVNFWNTWCIPCQQEEPVLAEFYAAHRDDPEFAMLAIVHDDSDGAVRNWIEANPDAGYPVVFDRGERAARQFGVTGQPESYFLTRDGRITAVQKGPADREDLELMLACARDGKCGKP